jgi:hypothetical protein
VAAKESQAAANEREAPFGGIEKSKKKQKKKKKRKSTIFSRRFFLRKFLPPVLPSLNCIFNCFCQSGESGRFNRGSCLIHETPFRPRNYAAKEVTDTPRVTLKILTAVTTQRSSAE